MNEQFIPLSDGNELQLRSLGNGDRELIILHGWTGNSEDWRPIMERLAETYTCLSWDQRPYFTRDAGIEKMADDVQQVIASACKSKPVLLGHSMGAVVTWEYIRQFGCSDIEALITVDMTPKMTVDNEWKLGIYGTYTESDNHQFIDECEADFSHRVSELILDGTDLTPAQKQAMREGELMRIRNMRLERLDARAWIDCWESFVYKDYRNVLKTIDVPTLLCYGERSKFYGDKVARFVSKSIPGSKLIMFENAGHSPQSEYPDGFAQSLISFSNALSD